MCTYFNPKSSNYNTGGYPKSQGHYNWHSHFKVNKYIIYYEKEEMEVIKDKNELYVDGQKNLSMLFIK